MMLSASVVEEPSFDDAVAWSPCRQPIDDFGHPTDDRGWDQEEAGWSIGSGAVGSWSSRAEVCPALTTTPRWFGARGQLRPSVRQGYRAIGHLTAAVWCGGWTVSARGHRVETERSVPCPGLRTCDSAQAGRACVSRSVLRTDRRDHQLGGPGHHRQGPASGEVGGWLARDGPRPGTTRCGGRCWSGQAHGGRRPGDRDRSEPSVRGRRLHDCDLVLLRRDHVGVFAGSGQRPRGHGSRYRSRKRGRQWDSGRPEEANRGDVVHAGWRRVDATRRTSWRPSRGWTG